MTNDRSLRVTNTELTQAQRITQRQQRIQELAPGSYTQLFSYQFDANQVGSRNCENCVGSVELPVGIAGPVAVQQSSFIVSSNSTPSQSLFLPQEQVYLPLATTEGALVASVSRGCKALVEAGGVRTSVKYVGMSRAPVFRCKDGAHAEAFVAWLANHEHEIAAAAEATSDHLQYLRYQAWIRGRLVFVRFVFATDQAMGMNMVTIALQTAFAELLPQLDGVELVSLSSNVCTDKKDSAVNQLLGRGYWVQAEAFITDNVINKILKTDSASLLDTHYAKNLIGSNLAGSHSQNMQAANVIAAIYAATGQDLAHVVEGAQSYTTFENVKIEDQAGVYAAVTLPSIAVGVVGGGTGLAAQTQARHLIRTDQEVAAQHLAAVVGIGVLAAEISGLAALSTHTLAQAHQRLGRVQ